MSMIAARRYEEEEERNEKLGYVLIFFVTLVISGFLGATAIKFFGQDFKQSSWISPLVRVARLSPLEVAVSHAATQPFVTDPVTPYREQLREAAILDQKVASPSAAEAPVSDAHVSAPAEPPVTKTKHAHKKAAGGNVLMAKAEIQTPAPQQLQAAPAADTGTKAIVQDEIITVKTADLKPAENIPAAPAAKAPVKAAPSVADSHAGNTMVASVTPAQVNSEQPAISVPVTLPVKDTSSASYSTSMSSPSISPSTTDPEAKALPTAAQDTPADVAKNDKPAQDEKKDKGSSVFTVLEWALKIVGIALVLLK